MNKKVSIISVNFNGKRFLDGLYNSLKKTTYDNYEIILVDNESIDKSYEYVKEKFPFVKVFRNKNTGYSGGNNFGLTKASGDYIVFLGNDVTVEPNWLTNLVNKFESEDNIGALGSIKLLMDLEPHLDLSKIREICNKDLETVKISGSLIFTSIKNIEKLGYAFDEKHFMYWEDTDLIHRLALRGYKNYIVHDSLYFHYRGGVTNIRGQTNSKKLFVPLISKDKFNSIYYYYRNEIYLILKIFEKKHIPFLMGRSFLRSIYNLVLRRNPNQIVSLFKTIPWVIKNRKLISEKRKEAQSTRIIKDKVLFKIHKKYNIDSKERVEFVTNQIKKHLK